MLQHPLPSCESEGANYDLTTCVFILTHTLAGINNFTGTRQIPLPFPTSPSPESPRHQPQCARPPPILSSCMLRCRRPHTVCFVCLVPACSVPWCRPCRVPGSPSRVSCLGSPASFRSVPVDAAASGCRAFRDHDPGGRTAHKS